MNRHVGAARPVPLRIWSYAYSKLPTNASLVRIVMILPYWLYSYVVLHNFFLVHNPFQDGRPRTIADNRLSCGRHASRTRQPWSSIWRAAHCAAMGRRAAVDDREACHFVDGRTERPDAVIGRKGGRASPCRVPILSRSRHRPVAVTDASFSSNLNRLGCGCGPDALGFRLVKRH
jgi:hypothetical protein